MTNDENQYGRTKAHNRMKMPRQDCGFSREQVAGAVGVSASTLGNLERGEESRS